MKIQEYETKRLIDELSKMPPMVIATAYLHAINYTLYGLDVTKNWVTATQNAAALERAYRKGYYEASQRKSKIEEKDAEAIEKNLCELCINNRCAFQFGMFRNHCEFYKEGDYKKAFRIACELLNGSILYGYDTERIFEEMMEKDNVVSPSSYEEFILNNINRLSGKAESEEKG